MDICNEKIIENYLLYKNPLYAFRFPLALLFGIFLYGYMEMKKWSTNSYINQLLIPIAGILVMMVLLDMIARMMVSKEEKKRLLLLCKLFTSKPMMKNMLHSRKMNHLDLAMIENYQGEIEGFENNEDGEDNESKKEKDHKDMKKDKEYKDTTEENHSKERNSENKDKVKKDKVKKEKEEEEREEFTNNNVLPNTPNVRPQVGAPMNYFENQEFVDFSNNALAYHVEPQSLPSKTNSNSKCIQNSDCCNLCSGMGDNPCNIIAPVPGPQWLPQTAAAKQFEMKNNQYSPSLCPIDK